MKSSIKICLVVSLTILATNSCKQLIDVDDPINQIGAAQVFQDKNTAYAALDHVYAELQTNSLFSGGSSGAGALLGSYADDLELHAPPYGSPVSDIYLNQLLADNSVVKTVWANGYNEIYMANALIEGMQSSAIAESDKKQILGEALVIRSMIYLQLMQIFGEIPYTTTTDYTYNQFVHKTSESEMLQLLEADLTQAVTHLPDTYRNLSRIYVNKKTAQLLLGNIYQLKKDWSKVEQICQTIISDANYSFELDINKVFKKGGKHILFQLKTLYAGAPTPESGIYYFSSVPPLNYVVSPQLVASFTGTDLRLKYWISKVENNGFVFYRNDKYKNFTTNNDEYSVVYRLENVYFMLAESLANLNRVSEAVPYVNKIRQRAGIVLLDGNIPKEVFLNELLAEKRREFFAEQGQRFFELKRIGQLDLLKQSKPNWKDFHRRWPIPLSEILLNANLNPQNPNY
ncbi:RagB/SusD family nutrient uptake outer membrane protein [Chryseobacterium koreense]|uniref:Glycan metabolism protein RagB n=1 Tax=Chryseobacterium koreense CCUG 49689 TaxID=1304281 RepID=A0A0J7IWP1_9FLAO|nr:RagB/SusD family nutrient uptake outer membrane protein [Chryseobacterium koreense]KMQ70214.1 hypothetical protein ACM44_13470 [Chryseobacterium koreense CCUG 49689]MBB5334788.1 hypothetical protein [Chryseobacterium koreense]